MALAAQLPCGRNRIGNPPRPEQNQHRLVPLRPCPEDRRCSEVRITDQRIKDGHLSPALDPDLIDLEPGKIGSLLTRRPGCDHGV